MADVPEGIISHTGFTGGYSVNANGAPVLWPRVQTTKCTPHGQRWLIAKWEMHTEEFRDGEVPVKEGDTASARVNIDGEYDLKVRLWPVEPSDVSTVHHFHLC